ncbi:MAG TPA: hypothetical protein ENJ82_10050, partial [Bacteroidetes bacterium]|nr:hypothetical protein [Bacteroidota bacterium]
MKILGLDLGTNSVGWALIERKNDDFKDIIDAGSRIVPLDPDLKKNFETGQAVSKTGDRRGTRGSRRLNARFRMRRDSLLRCLLAVGILPEIPDLDAEPQALDNLLLGKVATALELYEIRALATKEKVSLAELGRVLLHLNQRRGYQPTRSEKRKNSDNTDSTYGYFRIEEVKKTGEILSKKPELEVLLSNGKVGFSPDAKFEQLVGKEVPIEIKETTNKKKEVSVKLSLIGEKEDSWASRLGAMESELTASGQTPGQFYFRKLQEAGQSGEAFRIRQRLVYRTNYLAEFDQIWAEQIKHHPELADSNIFDKVIEAVMTPHNPMKNAWKKKGLGTFIRDFIIYFQRPLRSQKGSIGHCNFETEFPRRVIPKSHPFFQEFKLWNQINNLKIVRVDGSEEEISVLAKERLF